MDIADAINIMVYASDREGVPGCAVWDIFKAEDADCIRTFLTDKFRSQHSFTDPIHSQLFYLNSQLRKELFDSTGVVSWRIYQYPVGVELTSLTSGPSRLYSCGMRSPGVQSRRLH